MKIRNILSSIILILVLSITVGFSAFVSEMSISNIVADVRVEKDVRITDIKLLGEQCSGTSVSSLNYDADSILMSVLFSDVGSYAVFEVTITNIGNVDVSLADIVTSEAYYKYEIISGELGQKISGLGGTSKYVIKVSIGLPPMNVDMNVKINFDLRQVYTVTYENIINNGYPTEVISGGNLNITFTNDIPSYIAIYSNGMVVGSSLYTYSNGELVYNNVGGNIVIEGPKTLVSVMKNYAVSDSGVNFSSSAGLSTLNNIAYVRSGTENDSYPIYYYRGNVTANNVKFANFCWKMVRTTDTGGIKLIYNGIPAEDGSCNNTGTASQIGISAFNSTYKSPAHVGYMYGAVYTSTSKSLSSQTETYVYGNEVIWNGTNYTLSYTKKSSSWASDYNTLATQFHYTCFNTTGSCIEVYYINYFGSSSDAYYLTLKDGKDIEDVKAEMFGNTTDSKIKTVIDGWYESNMTRYTNLLEDTVWCNDRSITSGPLYGENANGTGYSYFGAYERNMNTVVPLLTCSNKLDSFTVSSSKGNGNLIYPVGLLTADEYTLAGSGYKGYSTTSYLHTGQYQWSLSPSYFYSSSAYGFSLISAGNLYGSYAYGTRGVRPAISLKEDTIIASGDGTVSSPYQIKTKIILDLSYYGYGDVYYEPGMTWEEWVNSEYNNVGFVIDGDYIVDEYYTNYVVDSSYTRILASTIINSSETYSLRRYI